MIIVIRAGGTGMRLWPLSRKASPKQFQSVLSKRTMFADAFSRALRVVGSPEKIFVSCNVIHQDLVKAQVPTLPHDHIIIEPVSKNTGPAMCLEVAVLTTRIPEDEIVLSIPSDDYVGAEDVFAATMKEAGDVIAQNPEWIYTPCAPGDVADSGYCYVTPGDEIAVLNSGVLTTVGSWIEKPDHAQCLEFVADGLHAIHTGMYMYVLGTMRQLFAELQPTLTDVCDRVAADEAGATDAYQLISPDSIETLIARQTPNIAMSVISGLKWSDVGKWHVIKRLLRGRGENVLHGNVVTKDTHNSLVYAPKEKIVAVIGLDNIVVVDTGDALLVAHADRSHEIKDLLPKVDERFK